jgi:hypothetical protein
LNDITTPAPSAPQPSSTPAPTPSTPIEPTPPQELAKLAQGENIDEYAEQRREDEGQINRDASPAERAFNRHLRKNHKIERLQAENARLKAERGETPASNDGSAGDMQVPEQATAEQPTGDEQQQITPEEFQERLTQEVHQTVVRERHAAVFRERERMLANLIPNHAQIIAQAPQVPIPDAVADQI